MSKHININEIVLQIDALRKLHVRFQNMCEYMLISPNSFDDEIEREKIKKCAIEIREYANEYKIQTHFEKFGGDWSTFSKTFRDEKRFATYWYKNVEITNLIVFVEKRVSTRSTTKKKNETIDALQQTNLELENDFIVLNENNENINVIKGVDL